MHWVLCKEVEALRMESRKDQVAQQLQALLRRHHLAVNDLKRLGQAKKIKINDVTVRRILKAEAETEPDISTLRRIAAVVGEDYEEAFPEKPQLIVEIEGRRFAMKSLDGKPLPPAIEERLRQLSTERARDIHETKRALKKRG
jgi:hypothetical protein